MTTFFRRWTISFKMILVSNSSHTPKIPDENYRSFSAWPVVSGHRDSRGTSYRVWASHCPHTPHPSDGGAAGGGHLGRSRGSTRQLISILARTPESGKSARWLSWAATGRRRAVVGDSGQPPDSSDTRGHPGHSPDTRHRPPDTGHRRRGTEEPDRWAGVPDPIGVFMRVDLGEWFSVELCWPFLVGSFWRFFPKNDGWRCNAEVGFLILFWTLKMKNTFWGNSYYISNLIFNPTVVKELPMHSTHSKFYIRNYVLPLNE